jgi:Na+-translocating ferredoxin:NAD+ oxidoreductase RnfE subunit
MGKKEERCALRNDLKGCALKHIGAARELISKGKIEDADAALGYAEKHLKENTCT